MLASSTVCYKAIAACKMFKLYISTTQGMLPYIYLMHIQTQSQDFWLNFKQCKLYLVSDHHTCLDLQSS